jgi:hypothetical protein
MAFDNRCQPDSIGGPTEDALDDCGFDFIRLYSLPEQRRKATVVLRTASSSAFPTIRTSFNGSDPAMRRILLRTVMRADTATVGVSSNSQSVNSYLVVTKGSIGRLKV